METMLKRFFHIRTVFDHVRYGNFKLTIKYMANNLTPPPLPIIHTCVYAFVRTFIRVPPDLPSVHLNQFTYQVLNDIYAQRLKSRSMGIHIVTGNYTARSFLSKDLSGQQQQKNLKVACSIIYKPETEHGYRFYDLQVFVRCSQNRKKTTEESMKSYCPTN